MGKVPNKKLFCKSCAPSKLRESPFPKATLRKVTRVGQELHHDYKPAKVKSLEGHVGCDIIVDRYSGKVLQVFVKGKSEVIDGLSYVKKQTENMTGLNVQVIRSDDSPENNIYLGTAGEQVLL